jgi:hypothetical protein
MITKLGWRQPVAANESDRAHAPQVETDGFTDSFPLLRYYLITNLLVITAITIAVVFLFVRRGGTEAEHLLRHRAGPRRHTQRPE